MSDYLTVTKLNEYIKSIVEGNISMMNISLIGEVSSLTKHYTGHYYFTLKDEYSTIRCMMFSQYTSRLDFNLKNGDQILIQGYVGVYEKGGTYQVYCRNINLYGEGQYLLMLAKLKEKLQNEGIFSKPKKQIPLLPKRIGLLTALSGAAIKDYICTISNRLKTEIYIFPCLMQGDEAPKSIIKALDNASNYSIDLLVITRGGGSKEDLKCFNDEGLIRRLFKNEVPLITAVGHQIDTTLIDYVADKACITPTDAANNSVPLKDDLDFKINNYLIRIFTSVKKRLDSNIEKLMMLERTLTAFSPLQVFNRYLEKINHYRPLLEHIIYIKLSQNYDKLDGLKRQLLINRELFYKRYLDKLLLLKNKLTYLNPKSLIEKGYSIIEDDQDQVITSIKKLMINQEITINLADGKVRAKIIKLEDK